MTYVTSPYRGLPKWWEVCVMKATVIVTLLCSSLILVLSACGSETGAEEFHNAGVALVNQGQTEEAIGAFDEAIRLDRQYGVAYNARGLAYSNLGQPQKAIEDYTVAILLDPQLAEAYRNRGLAYLNLGQN